MSPIPQLLRLLLLLLTPLWLSLAVEGLGLEGSMPSLLSNWRRGSGINTTLAPPSGWRERTYLAVNPDVAAAVRTGQLSSGYAHYVRLGRAEGRRGGFAGQAGEAAKPAPAQPTPEQTASQRTSAEQTVEARPAGSQPPPAEPPAAPAPPIPAPPLPAAKPELPDDAPARPTAVQTAAASTKPRHVERIRTANGGDGLRVVLDLDQDPRFETPVRRPDGRLEVMLPGTLWQAAPSGRLPATTLGYRAERSGSGTRLLFTDEEGGADGGGKGDAVRLLAVSTLPPDKDRGHRLLIDVALPSMAKAERKGR